MRYSRRSAALEAAASGLEDLVSCPACDYMVEMSDPNAPRGLGSARLFWCVRTSWCDVGTRSVGASVADGAAKLSMRP